MCFSSEEEKRGKIEELRAAAVVLALTDAGVFHTAPFQMNLIHLAAQIDLPLDMLCEAIPVGVSITRVVDRFIYWILSEELKHYSTSALVAELYRRRLIGDEPTPGEWRAACGAAQNKVDQTPIYGINDEAGRGAVWAAVAARDAASAGIGDTPGAIATSASHAASITRAAARRNDYTRYRDRLLAICRGEVP